MNATFLGEFYRPNPESQKVQPPATSRYISPIGYGYLYLPQTLVILFISGYEPT